MKKVLDKLNEIVYNIFRHLRAGVAQLVEQLICNQQVGGSNPSTSSTISYGGVPEWPKGADCKSVASSFDGSNPSSPTRKQANPSGVCLFFFFACVWIVEQYISGSPA